MPDELDYPLNLSAKTEEILALARSRAIPDRQKLLLAIVELCDAGEDGTRLLASAPIQTLLNSIFMTLVVEAERDIRKRLSEKLATADWAPSALINILALDDIEIARPVIALSPVLKDHDLVRLLVEATVEHQIEVARRPELGPPVVAAILQQSEPAVLTALAGNTTTALSHHDMARLVQASHRVSALRSPLARHPSLTDDLARELYVWVGQAIRQSLLTRFRMDPTELDAALGESVREAHGGLAKIIGVTPKPVRESDEDELEQRLIAKLDASGQLRPGFLVRTLQERKLPLFIKGLTALGRFDPDHIQRALQSDRPELLALACAAVGIDKSAFPTILNLVRELNEGRPDGGAEGARRANGAFGPFSPDIAATAFRQAVSKV